MALRFSLPQVAARQALAPQGRLNRLAIAGQEPRPPLTQVPCVQVHLTQHILNGPNHGVPLPIALHGLRGNISRLRGVKARLPIRQLQSRKRDWVTGVKPHVGCALAEYNL